MKNMFVVFSAVLGMLMAALPATAASVKDNEKTVLAEFKKIIPEERLKTVDDLYRKWQDVQAGKSQAILIDIRTEAEFDAGHIKDSNNVDSGHAYTLPDKIADPDAEIWVFCRTKHRVAYFAGLLFKYGYKNVYVVDGGIMLWAEKGLPLVNKYLGEMRVTKYENKMKEGFLFRENK